MCTLLGKKGANDEGYSKGLKDQLKRNADGKNIQELHSEENMGFRKEKVDDRVERGVRTQERNFFEAEINEFDEAGP